MTSDALAAKWKGATNAAEKLVALNAHIAYYDQR